MALFPKFGLKALERAVVALKRRGIEPNATTLTTVVVTAEALGVPFTAPAEGKRRIAHHQRKASRARTKVAKTRQNTDQTISVERRATTNEVQRLERQVRNAQSRGDRRVRSVRARGQRNIDRHSTTAATHDRHADRVSSLLAHLTKS